MGKKWWHSKTMWANALAVVGIAVQGATGFILSPEIQVAALGVINVVLRLITKEEIVW